MSAVETVCLLSNFSLNKAAGDNDIIKRFLKRFFSEAQEFQLMNSFTINELASYEESFPTKSVVSNFRLLLL